MKSTHWFPHPLLYTYPCALSLYPQQRTCHLYPSLPDPQAPWLPLQRVTVLVWPLLGEQQLDRRTERGRLTAREDQMNSLFASLHGEKIIGSTVDVRKERKRRGVLWVDAASGWYAGMYWGDEAPSVQEEVKRSLSEANTDNQKDRQW